MAYVVEGTEDKREKMLSIVVGFGSGLVGFFSKLAPEAVEHEFGRSFASRIFLDQRGIECDAFVLMVLANIAYLSSLRFKAAQCSHAHSSSSSYTFPKIMSWRVLLSLSEVNFTRF